MIKRMNKATSLLLAAAAVASIVPQAGVMAADYTKVESKEGTVYGAVAYKDGTFYVDGNVKDGENDGAYYLNNGKYNDLEDIDTGAEVEVYGEKYLSVDDGEYFIDLTTGKVTDEDIKENTKDDAAAVLRKKIKSDNDDRFTAGSVASMVDGKNLTEIPGNKFNAPYYKAQFTDEKDTNVSYTVYTDEKGNYIDGDYNLGAVKATINGQSYKLSKLDDEKNINVSISNVEEIAQDSNYIYRKAAITIDGKTAPVNAVNGLEVRNADGTLKGAFKDVQGNENAVSFDTIQKISKAQASGDIDGIKYAKTVTTTILSDDKGNAVSSLKEGADSKYTVVNGKVIEYVADQNNVDTRVIELKSTKGYYYTNITECDNEKILQLEVDAEGNLWRLYNGYVYKFDNSEEWEKVYKVDGSMTDFSVYDSKNLVLWNEDDEVFSVVGGKAADDNNDENATVKSGWVQNEDKTWSYYNTDGTQVKKQWINLSGTWFYIKEDGIMATGWLNDNGTWYYLNTVSGQNGGLGAMQTGWVKVNGTWYYLNTVSGQNGGLGAMQTGWLNDRGTWYYLNTISGQNGGLGAMQTGWLNDNGTWYYLNASGAMLKNTTVDGYRLGSNGAWIR